jgi:hypothetical protein
MRSRNHCGLLHGTPHISPAACQPRPPWLRLKRLCASHSACSGPPVHTCTGPCCTLAKPQHPAAHGLGLATKAGLLAVIAPLACGKDGCGTIERGPLWLRGRNRPATRRFRAQAGQGRRPLELLSSPAGSFHSPCAYRLALPVLYWVTFMVMCFLHALQKAFLVLGTFTWSGSSGEPSIRGRLHRDAHRNAPAAPRPASLSLPCPRQRRALLGGRAPAQAAVLPAALYPTAAPGPCGSGRAAPGRLPCRVEAITCHQWHCCCCCCCCCCSPYCYAGRHMPAPRACRAVRSAPPRRQAAATHSGTRGPRLCHPTQPPRAAIHPTPPRARAGPAGRPRSRAHRVGCLRSLTILSGFYVRSPARHQGQKRATVATGDGFGAGFWCGQPESHRALERLAARTA